MRRLLEGGWRVGSTLGEGGRGEWRDRGGRGMGVDMTQGCLKSHLLGLSTVNFLSLSLATAQPFLKRGPAMGGVGHSHTLQKSIRASSRCRMGAAPLRARAVVVEDLGNSRAQYGMKLR